MPQPRDQRGMLKMEKERTASQYPDICVCCGRPVPEGRMVCYTCETGSNAIAPCKPGISLDGSRRTPCLKEENPDAYQD